VKAVLDGSLEPPEQGRVAYSGLGPCADHAVVWQMERAWDDVVDYEPDSFARTFAAPSSPVRVGIIGALVDGANPTAGLGERIDAGTSGKLLHHLRDLLAAGLAR
jgi:hypothetical protein